MSQTTIAAPLRLPAPQPRGPVSTAVLDALKTGAADAPDSPVHELAARAVAAAVASGDLLRDDDLQLALFILQELHYRGIEGVDDDREWQPGVVGLRRLLERALEQELRDRVPLPALPAPTAPDVLRPRDGVAARTLLGVAVVSYLPTAYAGLADFLRLDRAQKRVATVHVAANSGALALGIASLWARRSDPTKGKLLSFAGASLLGAGGFLGGHIASRLGPPDENEDRASDRPLGQLATTDEAPDAGVAP